MSSADQSFIRGETTKGARDLTVTADYKSQMPRSAPYWLLARW
jgi:hypothetical protein